jgi:hypothetical protein
MAKVAEDPEDVARRHNSEILNLHVNRLRGSSQFRLVPVKDRNGAPISDRERVKERRAEHFKIVVNRDRVRGTDIEEHGEVCDTLDVKEDLFCEEELATALKGFKNNKAPVAESVVNEFLKYGGSEIESKLLKIVNRIFEKGEVTNNYKKTLINHCISKGIRVSVVIIEALLGLCK